MSIFDASVQDDWIRGDLIAKIKAAEKKYYNESPCLHCGPGNGCDDCRGCEDAQRNHELEMMLHDARQAYKDKFGHSYDEDLMIQQIVDKEKEVEHWRDHCKKCGGNFGDDCRDCSDWEKTFEVTKSLNWLKEDYKKTYGKDYDKLNKNNDMNKTVNNNDKIIDDCDEVIDAKAAHQLTDKEINDDMECLKPIMGKIKEAIKQKKYNCYISGSTKDYVIDKLKTLGFKIKLDKGDFRDPRESDVYEISW